RTSARSASLISPTTRTLLIEEQVNQPICPPEHQGSVAKAGIQGRPLVSLPQTNGRGRAPAVSPHWCQPASSGATPAVPLQSPDFPPPTPPPPGGQTECRTRLRSGGCAASRPPSRRSWREVPASRLCPPPKRRFPRLPAPPDLSRPWPATPRTSSRAATALRASSPLSRSSTTPAA